MPRRRRGDPPKRPLLFMEAPDFASTEQMGPWEGGVASLPPELQALSARDREAVNPLFSRRSLADVGSGIYPERYGGPPAAPTEIPGVGGVPTAPMPMQPIEGAYAGPQQPGMPPPPEAMQAPPPPGPQAPPSPGLLAGPQQGAPQQGGGGFLSQLFGGPSAGLLSPEQQSRAGGQALTDAGLAMMASTGGPRSWGQFGPTTLGSIAEGMQAGRQSYRGTVAEQTALNEREAQEERRQEIQQLLAEDKRDEAAAVALRGGDTQAAEAIYRSRPDAVGPVELVKTVVGDDIVFNNPYTGEEVRRIKNMAEAPDLKFMEFDGNLYAMDPKSGQPIFTMQGSQLTAQQNSAAMGHYGHFESRTRPLRDVVNSYRRIMPEAKALEQAMETGETGLTRTAALAMLSSYARMLDPNSVVKEGELKIQYQQGTILDNLNSWYKKAMEGGFDEDVMRSVMASAERQLVGQSQSYQDALKETTERMERAGLTKDQFYLANPFTEEMTRQGIGPISDPDWET